MWVSFLCPSSLPEPNRTSWASETHRKSVTRAQRVIRDGGGGRVRGWRKNCSVLGAFTVLLCCQDVFIQSTFIECLLRAGELCRVLATQGERNPTFLRTLLGRPKEVAETRCFVPFGLGNKPLSWGLLLVSPHPTQHHSPGGCGLGAHTAC